MTTYDEALESLRRAVEHHRQPLVQRLVRFPPKQERIDQLRKVGWLCFYLGAPREGLGLIDAAGGMASHVLRTQTAAAIAGLLAGDRGPAVAFDEILQERASHRGPPHDLGPEAVARHLEQVGSYPAGGLSDSLLTSVQLTRAIEGGFAADAGIPVAAVAALADQQLAAAGEPVVRRDADVDPDGDGVTVAARLQTLAQRAGRPWKKVSSKPSRTLGSWTFTDWYEYPLVEAARSWGWIMRTTDGLDAPLSYGIERLRPVAQLAAFADLAHYPALDWPNPRLAQIGDSAVVGDGPGRLLLLPRTTEANQLSTGDCPVWVFDESTRTIVHRAPTLWRFVRDA